MDIEELQIEKPRWGVSFTQRTATTGGLPLQTMPIPEQLIVALQQNSRAIAEPLVAAGSTVCKGQPIAAMPENSALFLGGPAQSVSRSRIEAGCATETKGVGKWNEKRSTIW